MPHADLASQIHLWLAFLDDAYDAPLLDDYRALISEPERQQMQRFVFAKDRHRHLVARTVTRTVLSRYVGVPAERLAFDANRYGKPSLVGAPDDLAFNVSHAGNLVVLAVSRGRALGVDTETIARGTPLTDLAERYFAREEADELSSHADEHRHVRFFEYWTLKESYIKARGMGLSLPLDRFGFRFPQPDRVSLWTLPDVDTTAARWRFWQYRPTAENLLALCAEHDGDETPPTVTATRIVPLRNEQTLYLPKIRATD